MEQNQTPKFATLFYDVAEQLEISWPEYLLLDMVYHLSYKTGYCYKTPAAMADNLRLTKRAVNYMIVRLAERGLLERLTNHTLRVTEVYSSNQYISGKKVPTPPKSGKSKTLGGKLTTPSGKSTTKQQGARVTENYNKKKPVAEKDGTGYQKYLDQRKQLGL